PHPQPPALLLPPGKPYSAAAPPLPAEGSAHVARPKPSYALFVSPSAKAQTLTQSAPKTSSKGASGSVRGVAPQRRRMMWSALAPPPSGLRHSTRIETDLAEAIVDHAVAPEYERIVAVEVDRRGRPVTEGREHRTCARLA